MAPNDAQSHAETLLKESIEKVSGELVRFDDGKRQLVDAINSAMRTAALISPVGALLFNERVSNAIKPLFQQFEELKSSCNEFIEAGLPVFSLIQVGFGWNNMVLPQLSGMVKYSREIRSDALRVWQGPAASAYYEKREGQQDGLQGLTNVVEDTGNWLIDVAALNAKFLIDIARPLTEAVEAIIEIAVELATAVGVLEAIDTAADAIAKAATAILTIAHEAGIHTADSIQLLSDARSILNNNSYFPEGLWPQAVNKPAKV